MLFCHKKSVLSLGIFSFLSCDLIQEKKLRFNGPTYCELLHTGKFTFHIHIRLSQETKSNKCNEIGVLLQRGFRLKFFTKYCIQL